MESSRKRQELFAEWLSEQLTPAQLSEIYIAYDDINKYFTRNGVLKRSLLDTTDIKAVNRVLKTVEHDRAYRFTHRKSLAKITSAVRFYCEFLQKQISDMILRAFSENGDGAEFVSNKDDKSESDESLFENTINFDDSIGNLAYTKPTYASYFGEEIENIHSWTDLYVGLIRLLYEDYSDRFPVGKYFNGAKRIDFGDYSLSKNMVAPRKIYDNLYVETNLSARGIVEKIRALLQRCLVDFENVVIRYVNRRTTDAFLPCDDTKIIRKNPSSESDKKDDLSLYKKVLENHFQKGFRLDSVIELEKFKKYWSDSIDENLCDDEELKKKIKKCGVFYDGRIYIPDCMISHEVAEKLFSYINDSFSSGIKAMYYESLYNKFSDEFLGGYIYSSKMLKEYLSYVNCGDYAVNDNFISKDKDVTVEPADEVKHCLIKHGAPMTMGEICDELNYISPQKVREAVSSAQDIISNGRSSYFHIDSAVLTDEYLDDISSIITDMIIEKRFISGKELIDAISVKYPCIIEQNDGITDLGLRNALRYKLRTKYAFRGNIISDKSDFLSMADVFAEFCKSRKTFTLDELRVLKTEMNTTIYFEAVYENSLRISRDVFVSKDQASFDIEKTDCAIDRFCTDEYIPLEMIEDFATFPYAGFQWNSYLLESYVSSYSSNYILLHSGFNENVCVGAIVKRSSSIKSFEDLLIDVIARSNASDKSSALNYLCDKGYLAHRSCSEIERIIIKANELRNRKEF